MNTRDLGKFGYREKDMAGDILKALSNNKDKTRFMGENVNLEFNPNSGNVFLVDDDFNVAMMTDEGILEDWFSCPVCGHEGFLSNMKHNSEDKECQEYLESIREGITA